MSGDVQATTIPVNVPRKENRMRSSLERTNYAEYRTLLSLTLLPSVFAMLTFASPAVAQESVFSKQEGQGYEVLSDGTLIVGSDVILDCPSLLGDTVGDVSKEIEVCTKVGFPPRGSDTLPDTGGLPLLTIAGALLILGAGGLIFPGRHRFVP